jgi:peptide chain release factor 3
VIQYRLQHEYGASCTYEPMYIYKACWVQADKDSVLNEFIARRKKDIAKDKHGRMVFLAETAWSLKTVQEAHPEVRFYFTDEF